MCRIEHDLAGNAGDELSGPGQQWLSPAGAEAQEQHGRDDRQQHGNDLVERLGLCPHGPSGPEPGADEAASEQVEVDRLVRGDSFERDSPGAE